MALESPETGLFVGKRCQRQALTQSVGRNDTDHDCRVYCGGVPRIRGTVRLLVGPLRFDQHATCTWPWKRAKSSDSGLLCGIPISTAGFGSVSRPKRYQPRWAPLSRLRHACFRHSEVADGSATFQLAPLHLVTFSVDQRRFSPRTRFSSQLPDCLQLPANRPLNPFWLPSVRLTALFRRRGWRRAHKRRARIWSALSRSSSLPHPCRGF